MKTASSLPFLVRFVSNCLQMSLLLSPSSDSLGESVSPSL